MDGNKPLWPFHKVLRLDRAEYEVIGVTVMQSCGTEDVAILM